MYYYMFQKVKIEIIFVKTLTKKSCSILSKFLLKIMEFLLDIIDYM